MVELMPFSSVPREIRSLDKGVLHFWPEKSGLSQSLYVKKDCELPNSVSLVATFELTGFWAYFARLLEAIAFDSILLVRCFPLYLSLG